jgi:hypothetical protein
LGGVPHGACIAGYGGGWGWVGGCGDVIAAGMCFAFRCAIYSMAFGWVAGVFCAVAVWIAYSQKWGAIKHGVLLYDNFLSLPEPCFIVPILFVSCF